MHNIQTEPSTELRDHIQYALRYWIFIVVIALGAAVVAFIVSSDRPDSYNVVQNYEIELVNRGGTADYQFGSYYDLQGSQLFVQHIMSLVRSAAVIEEIYNTAGISYEIDNYNRFTNQFRADQNSAQHFSVTFSQYTEDTAQKMATAMTTVLTERVASAQTDANGVSMFSLRSSEPVIVFKESPVALATAVAAVAGALFAIILVFIKRYLVN